jgi:hypothetical protein
LSIVEGKRAGEEINYHQPTIAERASLEGTIPGVKNVHYLNIATINNYEIYESIYLLLNAQCVLLFMCVL